MKTLLQPLATLALAGATFVLGQNNPPPHSQEVRTRALVIVDGDGHEAGRFASLDNITTFTMTPVGKSIVRVEAREEQLDAFFSGGGGGFELRSSGSATSFSMQTAAEAGKDPTRFSINQRPGQLELSGREPKSGGSFNVSFESQPQRMNFGFGNKFGGCLTAVDSDGVFSSSIPKRKPVEDGG